MGESIRRLRLGLPVRVAIYLAIIAVVLLIRGRGFWHAPTGGPPASGWPGGGGGGGGADTTLVIAGADLAPTLVAHLAGTYQRDYPAVRIRVQGGGTNQALEALINGRVDVALASRPLTAQEQTLFRAADGDSAIWYPIATGAVLLLAGSEATGVSFTLDQLRRFIAPNAGGGETPRPSRFPRRLFVPDPNTGVWDAWLARLGLADADALASAAARDSVVVFLADDAAVLAAVRAEPQALGLVSSFALPDAAEASDVRALPVAAAARDTAVAPTDDSIASGVYPLWHYLYVCCRGRGGIEGAKFVTHIVSDRGQRQIARAQFLPARLPLREIHLKRDHVGGV